MRLVGIFDRGIFCLSMLGVENFNTASASNSLVVSIPLDHKCRAEVLVVEDSCISGMDALSETVRAIGGKASIIVDAGIRRGSDIAKAVALGAEAVILGRAPLYGLAAGGAPGVARALDILKDEFDRTLALSGCRSVDELTPDLLT